MNDTDDEARKFKRKRKPTLHRIADLDRANAEQEHDRQPVPRAWREEFDRLRPIRPIAYETPAQRSEHARQASLARWSKAKLQLDAD